MLCLHARPTLAALMNRSDITVLHTTLADVQAPLHSSIIDVSQPGHVAYYNIAIAAGIQDPERITCIGDPADGWTIIPHNQSVIMMAEDKPELIVLRNVTGDDQEQHFRTFVQNVAHEATGTRRNTRVCGSLLRFLPF
jgi:hypothetical protein